MKSKFLTLIVAVVVAMSAAYVVACDNGNPPENPPNPDPQYVSLTIDEFGRHAEQIFMIENYLDVLGYKVDFNVQSQIDMISSDTTVSAILDVSHLDDVCVSVNLNSVITQPPEESSGSGHAITYTPMVTETEINLYLYNKTLYVDVTTDDGTLKDSLEGVENDLMQLIMQFMDTSAEAVELPAQPEVGVDEEAIAELEGFVDYLMGYATVSYCEELGHYILELNFEQGGTYEEMHFEPFAFTVELYVKNGRMTSAEYDFISTEIKFNGTLCEHSAGIEYPENPSEYNSILFETIEEILFGAMAG